MVEGGGVCHGGDVRREGVKIKKNTDTGTNNTRKTKPNSYLLS
jgi:hypothetical protein